MIFIVCYIFLHTTKAFRYKHEKLEHKGEPFLTPHLRYKGMLKVWGTSWEPFIIYQLTSTAISAQITQSWLNAEIVEFPAEIEILLMISFFILNNVLAIFTSTVYEFFGINATIICNLHCVNLANPISRCSDFWIKKKFWCRDVEERHPTNDHSSDAFPTFVMLLNSWLTVDWNYNCEVFC